MGLYGPGWCYGFVCDFFWRVRCYTLSLFGGRFFVSRWCGLTCFALGVPHFFPGSQDFYQALYTQSQAQFDTYVDSGTILNNYAHIFDVSYV